MVTLIHNVIIADSNEPTTVQHATDKLRIHVDMNEHIMCTILY